MGSNSTFLLPDGSQSVNDSWISQAWASGWVSVLFGVLALSVTTRLFSGPLSPPQAAENGGKPIPRIPYWFPVLGHIPNLLFAPATFMSRARVAYRDGAFALHLAGTTHNFIFHPTLATSLLGQRNGAAESGGIFKHIMCATFGFPRRELDKYDAGHDDLSACYKHLLSEPSLGLMVQKTIDVLKDNISNFVTFSPSVVDQTQWERTTGVDIITKENGESAVETNLLPLVRDFVAFTANPALMGSDFINNNPKIFSELWKMDKGFFYLITGLPRWIPFPPLLTAHIARRRIFTAIEDFEVALEANSNDKDPGSEWNALDDVSALVLSRVEIYRKHNFSIEARAACEVSLLWAMNANANPLIFWMLNRIYADRAVLAKLREEVAPYVRAVQPKQSFGIAEPPRLQSVDQKGLLEKCPLLKSSYIETLRVDTSIFGFRVMKDDLVLQGRDKNTSKFMLKKGSYAHAAFDLHHKDPAHFEDPDVWRADRHVVSEEGADGVMRPGADMGTIRPYGAGHSMCKGRAFAQKEVLIFIATIISFWDIEPAGGGPWKMPRHVKATGTYTTNDNTKVWITRRVLAEGWVKTTVDMGQDM